MKPVEIGSIGHQRRLLTIDMTERTGIGKGFTTRRLGFWERLRILFGARLVIRLKSAKER